MRAPPAPKLEASLLGSAQRPTRNLHMTYTKPLSALTTMGGAI